VGAARGTTASLVPALASFHIGVEIGQIGIIRDPPM
jgi:hypothetical protein